MTRRAKRAAPSATECGQRQELGIRCGPLWADRGECSATASDRGLSARHRGTHPGPPPPKRRSGMTATDGSARMPRGRHPVRASRRRCSVVPRPRRGRAVRHERLGNGVERRAPHRARLPVARSSGPAGERRHASLDIVSLLSVHRWGRGRAGGRRPPRRCRGRRSCRGRRDPRGCGPP